MARSREDDDEEEYEDEQPLRRRGCYECGSKAPPETIKKMSAGGWAMFIILLLFCFPLCWIPFVVDAFKESRRVCQSCGHSIQMS